MFSWNINGYTKEKIVKIKGVRTFKFGDGNKLNSLYKVILPCVIADIEVSIITDVVNSDIPLLLSKDTMKRAGTCLNFEDDTAKKKLLGKSPGSTSKKNPHVIVSATEIKSNSSFFNKDANTTSLNDMNATRLHFDSSDSEENLNRKRKKERDAWRKRNCRDLLGTN